MTVLLNDTDREIVVLREDVIVIKRLERVERERKALEMDLDLLF
jgi:uncharacterized protein (UPF0335 family)